jgi:hypothetical protein
MASGVRHPARIGLAGPGGRALCRVDRSDFRVPGRWAGVAMKSLSERRQAADQRAIEEYTQLHNRLVSEFGAVHDLERMLAHVNAQPNPRKALRRSIEILTATLECWRTGRWSSSQTARSGPPCRRRPTEAFFWRPSAQFGCRISSLVRRSRWRRFLQLLAGSRMHGAGGGSSRISAQAGRLPGLTARAPTTDTIAAELTVPERVLLFCLASDTNWAGRALVSRGQNSSRLLAAGSRSSWGSVEWSEYLLSTSSDRFLFCGHCRR